MGPLTTRCRIRARRSAARRRSAPVSDRRQRRQRARPWLLGRPGLWPTSAQITSRTVNPFPPRGTAGREPAKRNDSSLRSRCPTWARAARPGTEAIFARCEASPERDVTSVSRELVEGDGVFMAGVESPASQPASSVCRIGGDRAVGVHHQVRSRSARCCDHCLEEREQRLGQSRCWGLDLSAK